MGSSGGGGASGAVSHSAYLETIHADWLNTTGVDVISKSMTDVMDTAIGNSPWTGLSAYDPDADITAYEAVLSTFEALLSGLSDTVDWAALHAQAVTSIGNPVPLVIPDMVGVSGITNALIAADVVNFAIDIDNEIVTRILPRFRRGMQDINAVVSSAFPIGEAVIDSFRNQAVAKHDSTLRLGAADKNAQILLDVGKSNMLKDVEVGKINLMSIIDYQKMYTGGTDQMVQMMGRRITWNEEYVKIFIEGTRIKIVARKEEIDKNAAIDEADAKWDLGVFQFGSNLLASIGGGTAVPYMPGTNTAASVLGGTLAVVGAAAQVYSAVK